MGIWRDPEDTVYIPPSSSRLIPKIGYLHDIVLTDESCQFTSSWRLCLADPSLTFYESSKAHLCFSASYSKLIKLTLMCTPFVNAFEASSAGSGLSSKRGKQLHPSLMYSNQNLAAIEMALTSRR